MRSLEPEINERDTLLLSRYLDNDLSEAERSTLEARLLNEPLLNRELQAMRMTIMLMKRLPEVPAPRAFTLTPQMLEAAPATLQLLPRPQTRQQLRRAPWYFSAAAALFVFVLGAALLWNNLGTGIQPDAPQQIANLPTPMATSMDVMRSAPALAAEETEFAETVADDVGGGLNLEATRPREAELPESSEPSADAALAMEANPMDTAAMEAAPMEAVEEEASEMNNAAMLVQPTMAEPAAVLAPPQPSEQTEMFQQEPAAEAPLTEAPMMEGRQAAPPDTNAANLATESTEADSVAEEVAPIMAPMEAPMEAESPNEETIESMMDPATAATGADTAMGGAAPAPQPSLFDLLRPWLDALLRLLRNFVLGAGA